MLYFMIVIHIYDIWVSQWSLGVWEVIKQETMYIVYHHPSSGSSSSSLHTCFMLLFWHFISGLQAASLPELFQSFWCQDRQSICYVKDFCQNWSLLSEVGDVSNCSHKDLILLHLCCKFRINSGKIGQTWTNVSVNVYNTTSHMHSMQHRLNINSAVWHPPTAFFRYTHTVKRSCFTSGGP